MTAVQFPVLCLGPDRYSGDTDNERYYRFESAERLARARRGELRNGARLAAVFYDNSGTSFRLQRVWVRRHLTPIWMRVLMTLFNQSESIEELVDYELTLAEPISFPSIKARVCASIERNKREWADDDHHPDQPGRPYDVDALVSNARAAVEGAVDVRTLFERLDAAWPY